MKTVTLAATLITSSLLFATHAQLVPFLIHGEPTVPDVSNNKAAKPLNQRPMADPPNPGFQLPKLPPSNSNNNDKTPDNSDAIILSDALPTEPSISIFTSITNALPSISNLFSNPLQNTTILAPKNSAITALPRKPWEDPADYKAFGTEAYKGSVGEDRAQRNMRRFAEAHLVAQSPWSEGERVRTAGGEEVWWEMKEGGRVVMPGEVRVEAVVKRVANGEVWVLEGVRNYAE